MKQHTLVALAMLCLAINTTAQVLTNSTSRYYLPTATTFSQAQIDSFNTLAGYQFDIVNGTALTYPDLQPITLVWNGTTWVSATPVAITNAFTTPLMVGTISHTATATAGAITPNVVVDWADVSGVTQYRFRIRPLGGTWNTSTITGSQRALNTLQYATTYECQIRVYVSASVQGEYTQSYTFTTPNFVPLPPCNAPSVSGSIVGNQLILSWASVAQGVGYQVQIRQLGSLVWGGTTANATTYTETIDTTKAYEYRVRTNCTGASTAWSEFTATDTATKAICAPPTALYNVGNTFYWSDYQYATTSQIQTRLAGSTTWGGGTSTSNGTHQFKYLWGQHEWRVRSRCYATTSEAWTDWVYGVTGFIPQPQTMEQFSTELAYPNPANEQVNLQGGIVLRDLTGRVIATGNDVLDVSQIAEGLYFVNGQKLIIKH